MKNRKLSNILISIITTALIITGSAGMAFAESIVVKTPEDLKKAVYSEMVSRNNNFSITYLGTKGASITENTQDFFKTVYAGNDDYLEWNRQRFYYSYSQVGPRIDFKFEVSYLTTKAQEAYVDSTVASILSSIIKPQMDDYKKLLAIHNYICDNVSYDKTLKKYSAYAALAQ